jgi:hypothetical protein
MARWIAGLTCCEGGVERRGSCLKSSDEGQLSVQNICHIAKYDFHIKKYKIAALQLIFSIRDIDCYIMKLTL